jgi:hypothetical protein
VVNIASANWTWQRKMTLNDQDKITIAQEYFIRADQGRPDIIELFHEFGLGQSLPGTIAKGEATKEEEF